MSDAGRKDFTTSMLSRSQNTPLNSVTYMHAEAKEELTPDSTKSTQDKIKEGVTDTTDRFARGAQSDESKSAPQEVADKTQRAHDNHAHGGATSSM